MDLYNAELFKNRVRKSLIVKKLSKWQFVEY